MNEVSQRWLRPAWTPSRSYNTLPTIVLSVGVFYTEIQQRAALSALHMLMTFNDDATLESKLPGVQNYTVN